MQGPLHPEQEELNHSLVFIASLLCDHGHIPFPLWAVVSPSSALESLPVCFPKGVPEISLGWTAFFVQEI